MSINEPTTPSEDRKERIGLTPEYSLVRDPHRWAWEVWFNGEPLCTPCGDLITVDGDDDSLRDLGARFRAAAPVMSDALRLFVIEAGHLVPSAAAALNGSLEGMALREAWLGALAEVGLTEAEADKEAVGRWKRGLAAKERCEAAAAPVVAVPITELDADDEAMVCTGCGTTKTVAYLRSRRGTTISCCPEREMIPVRARIAREDATLPDPAQAGEVERLRAENERYRIALEAIRTARTKSASTGFPMGVYPDPAAWMEACARAALASSQAADPAGDDRERCIACDAILNDGDPVYGDASGGHIHASCCGSDRESYTGEGGEPLKDGEPIPKPFPFAADPAGGEGR